MRQIPGRLILDSAREIPVSCQPGIAGGDIETIFFAVRDAYADAWVTFAELRYGDSAQREVVEIVAESLEYFRRQSRLATLLTVAPSWDEKTLSPMFKVQLRRILQEALANIHKHAAATRVAISLTVEAERAHVRIEDDGCGFFLSRVLSQFLHPTYPRHGLPAMRDHARAIGGMFRIESSPGRGACISVRIPVSQG